MSSDHGTTSEAREVRTTRLPASTAASAHARGFVVDTLRRWQIEADALDDAELVVSELVTNAFLHGGAPEVAVAVADHGDAVLLEVSHHEPRGAGPAAVAPLTVGADDTHGRGLTIVDVLAAAWGVVEADDHRRVWARLVGSRTGVVRAADRPSTLAVLAAGLGDARHVGDVQTTVSAWASAHLATAFAGLALLEASAAGEPHLRYVSLQALPPDAGARWDRFPVALPAPATNAFREARPLFHESRSAVVAGFPTLGPSVVESDLAAFAHLPLLRDGGAFGVLALGWAHGRVLEADDRTWLTEVAVTVAGALTRVAGADAA